MSDEAARAVADELLGFDAEHARILAAKMVREIQGRPADQAQTIMEAWLLGRAANARQLAAEAHRQGEEAMKARLEGGSWVPRSVLEAAEERARTAAADARRALADKAADLVTHRYIRIDYGMGYGAAQDRCNKAIDEIAAEVRALGQEPGEPTK